jgi:hypothetical protein
MSKQYKSKEEQVLCNQICWDWDDEEQKESWRKAEEAIYGKPFKEISSEDLMDKLANTMNKLETATEETQTKKELGSHGLAIRAIDGNLQLTYEHAKLRRYYVTIQSQEQYNQLRAKYDRLIKDGVDQNSYRFVGLVHSLNDWDEMMEIINKS